MAEPVAWVCPSCGTFNDGTSRSCAVCSTLRTVTGPVCIQCDHPLSDADRFCRGCGFPVAASSAASPSVPTAAVPVAAPLSVPASSGGEVAPGALTSPVHVPPPSPGHDRSRSWIWITLGVVVVLLAGGGTALWLAGGDDSSSTSASSTDAADDVPSRVKRSTTTRFEGAEPAPSTAVTTPPPSPTTAGALADGGASFVTQVDRILTDSSAVRGRLGQLLDEVRSCSASPAVVSAQIDDLTVARVAALGSVMPLDTGGSADAVAAKGALVDALSASRDSDQHYADGVRRMTQCGPLPMSDPDLVVARDDSDPRATQAKQRFIAVYNPLAARFGARSDWVEAEI